MANPFCHVELHSNDIEQSKAFYTGLFGWSLNEVHMEGGSYTLIDVGEGTGGGMMDSPAEDVPNYWMAYVLVDDIEAATAKARSLGADIRQAPTEIRDYGWLSVIADPDGAVLGLWQVKA